MFIKIFNIFVSMAIISLAGGCVVLQPKGLGQEIYLRADGTPYKYWLYMPVNCQDYHTLPLVVSLHGLSPFDSAHGQCREWQEQADIYGFVIVAPELRSSNLFAPLPLNTVTDDLKRDGKAIITILQEIAYSDWFDPNAVLITSWSYGGYISHWIANKYPEFFTCLAVRQSNFSKTILDSSMLSKYRYSKIGIFSASNDFAICRKESKEAVEWYSEHNFNVTFSTLQGRGHERIPGPAAKFFITTLEKNIGSETISSN